MYNSICIYSILYVLCKYDGVLSQEGTTGKPTGQMTEAKKGYRQLTGWRAICGCRVHMA